mmetsp:Transcript_58869/g.129227  ORF Transcript_58869/g.129227 Transcript_58869/m.129227 type:complete len:262 (-) Transcript_58869:23-808(-)
MHKMAETKRLGFLLTNFHFRVKVSFLVLLVVLLLVVLVVVLLGGSQVLASLPGSNTVALVLHPGLARDGQGHLCELGKELLLLSLKRDGKETLGAVPQKGAHRIRREGVGCLVLLLQQLRHLGRHDSADGVALRRLGSIHPKGAVEEELVLALDCEVEQRVGGEEVGLEDDVLGFGFRDDLNRGLHMATLQLGSETIRVKGLKGAVADECLILGIEDLSLGLLLLLLLLGGGVGHLVFVVFVVCSLFLWTFEDGSGEVSRS